MTSTVLRVDTVGASLVQGIFYLIIKLLAGQGGAVYRLEDRDRLTDESDNWNPRQTE